MDNGYKSSSSLFRSLSGEEVAEFRKHARNNYRVGTQISDLWHPVYKGECMEMNAEAREKQNFNPLIKGETL